MSLQGAIRDGINRALRPLGVQVVRGYSADRAIQPFLSARKTVKAARRAGLSVEDYVDRHNAAPGATAATVEALLRLADLGDHVTRVCEIGAGTGRYLARVNAALRPEVYEVYETAQDWLPRLRTQPNVIIQPADGRTLRDTRSTSVDLVHAHKVFVYLPLVTIIGYLEEMARVVRPDGGIVAFDIITDDCLDEATIKAWVSSDATLYGMMSRAWTIDLLARRHLSLVGSHFVPLTEGRTELLVFRRD